MMTTSMNSVNMVLIPRQITQPAQTRASEKTVEEALKEEQPQTENIPVPKISTGKSPVDIRMFGIQKAADAGLLRPVWLEMMEMLDGDMPRTRDLVERAVKNGGDETELVADEAKRVDESGRVATDEAKRAVESEGAANVAAARTDKSARAATVDEAKQVVKTEDAVDGTAARADKSARAATTDGTGQSTASLK
ncbi:MAG: hypothetical protein LBJ21_02970 [Acidobacteriota bacterium]|jgi:hypothetical protein|nr:hypothetical protein [Acidobacteriota bacterium]